MVYRIILLSLAAFLYAFAAGAQNATLPPSADPGRVDERLQPLRPVVPSLPTVIPEPKEPLSPELLQEIRFTLNRIDIKGMTVYQQETFEPLYADLIHQTISLEQIHRLAAQMTQRYQEDGYFLSKAVVPSQEIVDGVIEIAVIEGHIDRVEQTGNRHKSTILDGMINDITAKRPANIHALERSLLLMNDLPGTRIKSVLVPDETNPDAAKLVLDFSDKDFIQNVSFDNFGTRYLGPYQLGTRLGVNHLIMPYQQTQAATYQSINFNELQYYYLSHDMPVTSKGTKLHLTGSYNKTQPGYRLEPSDVKGRSYTISADMTHPLIRSRQENLYGTVSLDWVHSETDILGTDLFQDDLRVLRLAMNYDGSDRYDGSNFASVLLSQGFGILGASDENGKDRSRAEADGSFSKVEGSFARLQTVGSGFDLYALTSGQLADGPLLSSEEFGYGGRTFGRGYDSSEITGDHGLNGVLELRYNNMPDLFRVTTQLYSFYDAGKVWNEDLGSHNVSGTSSGLGIRFNYDNLLSGDLGIAFPLTLGRSVPDSSHPKDPHLYFSLNARF